MLSSRLPNKTLAYVWKVELYGVLIIAVHYCFKLLEGIRVKHAMVLYQKLNKKAKW